MSEETKFLLMSLVDKMVYLVMNEYKMSMSQALDLVYTSETYSKIEDLETGLYYQSAAYNFNLLKHEIAYGKIV
ncbi:MAG: hypothetical protein PUD94_06630 [Prevotellaceae bacterium]|nr:hypothetical protein [Prevotellaceae bacterium]